MEKLLSREELANLPLNYNYLLSTEEYKEKYGGVVNLILDIPFSQEYSTDSFMRELPKKPICRLININFLDNGK